MTGVLVTAATGTVGTHVVRSLLAAGVRPRVLSRDPARAQARLGEGVEVAVGDFGEPESVQAALEGVDRLFLACPNDPRQLTYETTVIDAAVAAGVGRVVKLSAVGAAVGSPLGFWDCQGRIEAHLRASGLRAVVLRPTTFMTMVLASAPTIAGTGQLFAPAGDAAVAMIDPRDVAAVAASLLAGDAPGVGDSLTLTGPVALSFAAIADELSAVLGRPVEYVNVPDDAARAGLVEAGLSEWLVANVVTLFGLIRAGVMATATTTVTDVTGRPAAPFADFARDHAAAFSPPREGPPA